MLSSKWLSKQKAVDLILLIISNELDILMQVTAESTHANNESLELPLAHLRQKHHISSISTLPRNLQISARFHKHAFINLKVKHSDMSFKMTMLKRSFYVCTKTFELILAFLHLTAFHLHNLFKQATEEIELYTVNRCDSVLSSLVLFRFFSLSFCHVDETC